MEEIKVTDELLKEILPKVSDELIKEWEDNVPKEGYKFSERYIRNRDNLIREHKKKKSLRGLWTAGKIAAVFVLVFGIVFFGSTMVAKANLDVLFKKIEVALESSDMYVYDEKTDKHHYNFYEPDYVPEGYEEIARTEEERFILLRYANKEGKVIYWSQFPVDGGMIYGNDEEYEGIIEKEYAGDKLKVYIYENGMKRLYYEVGNCVFIVLVDNISVEEIYEIIVKMKKIEK